jgi:MFS family permease
MSSQATNPAEGARKFTTRPYVEIAGVLLGAMIATCTGRLMNVGLVDIRGALHLGVDEASWINTSFNASMMFIGPFSVYLGGLLGPRRVLLACAWIFTAVAFLIPFCHALPPVIALLIGGLTAGTFYPLTLTFVLRNLPIRFVLLGIAMYATDIVFTTDMAQAWESFFMEHLSWRWIFWNGAIFAPLMILLIHFGIPWQPLPQPQPGHPAPNWRGFLYASLGAALLYIALDVRGFLPLQEAPVLFWVALPQFVLGIAAMALTRKVDPRLIITAGFCLVAIACLLNSRVTSAWAGPDFSMPQAVMAVGLALAFNSMVGSIILEVIDTGALSRPVDVPTFACLFRVTRLFGGEIGSAFMGHFIAIREQFHSNMLGLTVQLGNGLTDHRLLGLRGAFSTYSTGLTATGRAAEALALQLRQQAFTLAISDSFILLATCCAACLAIVGLMSTVPTQYRQVIASNAGTK